MYKISAGDTESFLDCENTEGGLVNPRLPIGDEKAVVKKANRATIVVKKALAEWVLGVMFFEILSIETLR